MCWSGSASIAATALGAAATAYGVKKKAPKIRTFTLGFFTLMELLQAVSYIWINQCDVSGNIILTYLSYLHIVFQPPVMSAFMMSFISEKQRKKWFKPIMILSFLASLLMFIKLFAPVIWTVPKELMCKATEPLCGTNACTYEGNWHLAWRVPLLGIYDSAYVYYIPMFLFPLLYGCWRFALYHLMVGPLVAFSLTTDHNEAPAIWCLFSIAILGAVFIKPLTRWFETPMRKK